MDLHLLQSIYRILKVAVHQGQSVELGEQQELLQRQLTRHVLIVLDVEV